MLVGLFCVGTFGVTMVLSQLYLPRHVGMASGLSIGLAMGLGGIAAVALGAVADAIDLESALYLAAIAKQALRHRILLNFEGQAQGIASDNLIEDVLQKVPRL